MHAGLNLVLIPSSRTWPGNETRQRVPHHHSMRMHSATHTHTCNSLLFYYSFSHMYYSITRVHDIDSDISSCALEQ